MANRSQRTKEQKQTRAIQIIAMSVIILIVLAFVASLAFGSPTATPTVTADACNPNGYGTITSGTPILYQGQVLGSLSVSNGYIMASVQNYAPQPVNQIPMVDGDEISLEIEIAHDGKILGKASLQGYMCGGTFYFTTPIEFIPSQNALMPNHEATV